MEGFRWNINQDKSNDEIDGFKISHFCEWRMIYYHLKDKGEQLHSGLQDEECLNSSKKNLDEHFEKELNPLWTIM